MKLLWLTNVPLLKIKEKLGLDNKTKGGWLDGASNELLKDTSINMHVLFPYQSTVNGEINNISFSSFSQKMSDNQQQNIFKDAIKKYNPDIIHIFGTEYKHSYNMIMACQTLNVVNKAVISIQGLVSVYAKHYYANLPMKTINSQTTYEIIKHTGIRKEKLSFSKRGEYEIKTIQMANNVIGRTDWDKACSLQINPNLNYYLCNETLRNCFYNNIWDFNNCCKHSIFVSQSNYPIKGFHMIIEAMPEVLKRFPDATIYTTGRSPFDKKSLKEKLKCSTYEKYIKSLIISHKLKNKIHYLGYLNEEDMCNAYLNSNIFVSSSSIENSPNSVGEAMLLGVPTIASDVGGVKNMLQHNKDGFTYPFDEPYMLSYYICQLFENPSLQLSFSQSARQHASLTHNRIKNNEQLVNIYKQILENN